MEAMAICGGAVEFRVDARVDARSLRLMACMYASPDAVRKVNSWPVDDAWWTDLRFSRA